LFKVIRFDMSALRKAAGEMGTWSQDTLESWAAELPKLLDRVDELHDLHDSGEMDAEQAKLYELLLPSLVSYSQQLEKCIESASWSYQSLALELKSLAIQIGKETAAAAIHVVLRKLPDSYKVEVIRSKLKASPRTVVPSMLRMLHK